jgi:hypothetical protein
VDQSISGETWYDVIHNQNGRGRSQVSHAGKGTPKKDGKS